jgi:transcriptional regulator with XRE-family HTH domain
VDDANGIPHEDVPQGEDKPAAPPSRRRGASASAESADAATPAPARTIGEALRQAREAAGLTLAQVAERTKVRPGILSEIEADDHDKLPALTYSLGFVKAYARTVGLDPAEAAERYRVESQKGDPVPTMVDLLPLEEKRLPSPALVAGSVALLLLLLGGFWAWGAGWLTPAAPPVPETPVAMAEAATPSDADPSAAPAGDPAAPAADPAAAVTLTAKEEVWLRISDGQETLFMGTMSKGQTMTLPQGRAWTLRTGRAGALDVKVGATAIPPLGGPAEQVRNLSLKPADLLARPATGGLAPATPAPAPGLAPPAAGIRPVG